MLLVTKFDFDADIIDVPLSILNDIEDYQKLFFKWLFDKTINHSYWLNKNGKKYGCSYRSDAFIDWLNENPLKKNREKAKVVSQFITEYNKALPILCF